MTTSAGKADETYAKLDKFDGSDPASYRKWRRKAEPMLLALPTTFEKTRWGPKLMEYITGEAEELLEHAERPAQVFCELSRARMLCRTRRVGRL